MHERCEALSTQKAEALLFHGSGWGALELRRDAAALRSIWPFPMKRFRRSRNRGLGCLKAAP